LVHTCGTSQGIEDASKNAGGRAVVMQRLRVSKQTLSDWKRDGRVSPHKAADLESMSGVPKEKLCPDFNWGTRRKKERAD